MSDLQKMMDHLIEEKARLDKGIEMDTVSDSQNISVTLRIPKNIVALIEHFATYFDCSRSQFGKDVLVSAIWDVCDKMNMTEEDIFKIYEDYKNRK
jgi:hypothetical protein